MKNKIVSFIKKKLNEEKAKAHGFKLIETIIIVIITFVLGALLASFAVFNIVTSRTVYVEVIPERQNTDVSVELQEFIDTYDHLISGYYKDLDSKELINNAINGMLEGIEDPYSSYLNEEELKAFNERLSGDYKGIGAEIRQTDDNNVAISKPFNNTPAMSAGLKPGDVIKSVDGENALGLTTLVVSNMIKGPAGTTVNMVIIRDGEEITFNIVRAAIEIPSVSGEVVNKNNRKVGYLKVDIFSQITDTQFNDELIKLEDQGIDSLIIDVRGNSGGYLHVVKNIISIFLDRGEIVYQVKDHEEIEIIKDVTGEARTYDIVMLIDGGSASASEILAGALKESYGATLIGTNTFGKGTVQETFELATGGLIKFTTKEWLTPLGNSIDVVGIKPDQEVALTDDYLDNPISENDAQLQAALKQLTDK